jgi:membrane protease YdiL (CAAX protease family)
VIVAWLRKAVGRAPIPRVPRSHPEPEHAVGRRRAVVLITFVVGTALLAVSLRVPPGDARFLWLTALLAATWAVGGLLSGPLHLGRTPARGRLRRPVLMPLGVGLTLAGVFALGALIVREIPPLRDSVDDVSAHAAYGSLAAVTVVTVATGIAEEIFFRGGLFAAIGRRHPVAVSTAAYVLATVATGNVMLVFAAAVVGVVLGLLRRASGGILAPMIAHVTWSIPMLYLLPAVFAG